MNKQAIIVVETKGKGKSDEIYINEIIRCFYPNLDFPVKFVYLNGKGNFKKNKVITEIDDHIKKGSKQNFNSSVIYVLDKDNFSSNSTDNNLFNIITEFCNRKSYKIIWFVKTIEGVLLGRVPSNDKTKEASRFKRENIIATVNERLLRNENPQVNRSSNVLVIFDEVLQNLE